MKNIAPEAAWSKTTGSSDVVVAVIDSGNDYSHPDLNQNLWVNIDEIKDNSIDDDNNGYIDDYYGWDFISLHYPNFGDNDPMDDLGHGTHVAGTIGAIGNNNIGVVGVNWKVKMMPLKIFNDAGSTTAYRISQAHIYAANNGAKISNNSYGIYISGYPPYSWNPSGTINNNFSFNLGKSNKSYGIVLNQTNFNSFILNNGTAVDAGELEELLVSNTGRLSLLRLIGPGYYLLLHLAPTALVGRGRYELRRPAHDLAGEFV